jgi:two-component sensor histidine kinase
LVRSQRAFNTLVIGCVVLGFVTLVAVGLLAITAMAQNFNFTNWVAHTYRAENDIVEFRTTAERIETARRGYLLSHDERFVGTVISVRGELGKRLDAFQRFTSDNPAQQANVAQMRTLVAQHQKAVDVSILFARGGANDTTDFFNDAGVVAIRSIRAQSDAMLAEEERKLAIRDRARLDSVNRLIAIAVAAGALLIAVALGSLLVILRYTRDLASSRAALAELNRGLEAEVASRTADLQTSNTRLEALLHEVNHRVANSLQLVSAFVQMQAQAVEADEARSALKDTQRRIEAITQVHRRLYSSGDAASVNMQDYLAALVGELEDTLSSTASPRRLSLVSDEVRLETDRAVSVGVIVNELVTNACKYAYKRGEAGEVRIRLADAGQGLTLTVEDDGTGMPSDGAVRGTGLGGRLIKAMAASLNSEVVYDADHSGVRAILRLPSAA